MEGYHPPYQSIPIRGINYETQSDMHLATHYHLQTDDLDAWPDRSPVVAPILAVAELVRMAGALARNGRIEGVQGEDLRRIVHDQYRITEPTWPLSLSGVVLAVRQHIRDAMSPRAGGGEGLAEAEVLGTGSPAHGLMRLQASSVPISRHVYKMALVSGYPIAIGIGIGESWHDVTNATTGRIRLPALGEAIIDGTCVVIVGWSDQDQAWRFRHMSGRDWGEDGEGWLPYDYAVQTTWCHEAIVITSI